MSRMLATFFGAGLIGPAPGTVGSLVALPVGWAIAVLGGPFAFITAIAVAILVGFWAIRAELATSSDPDPSEIVIDEVAGQWIALLPVILGAAHVHADLLALWPGWVAGFLLFRLFDIWKPGPIGWADRRGGAVGVMLDDLIAGIVAALCSLALAALAHGVLMR
jgi:phosphatidylglycerophosphatase A